MLKWTTTKRFGKKDELKAAFIKAKQNESPDYPIKIEDFILPQPHLSESEQQELCKELEEWVAGEKEFVRLVESSIDLDALWEEKIAPSLVEFLNYSLPEKEKQEHEKQLVKCVETQIDFESFCNKIKNEIKIILPLFKSRIGIDSKTEIEFENECGNSPVIKVIGVGGGGSNTVKRISGSEMIDVEFYAVNTDVQALQSCHNAKQIQIGADLIHGLGAGSNSEIGQKSAHVDYQKLKEIIDGADIVFITAGMGRGTGTGAAPVIAQLARNSGALTIAMVTRPFRFEGRIRELQAKEGIAVLRDVVDALIVIPNQKLLEVVDKNTPIITTFKRVDDVLMQGIRIISTLCTIRGELTNLNLADIRAIMSKSGGVLISEGEGCGENRMQCAVQKAFSPLLDESPIIGATSALVIITHGPDDNVALHEIDEALGYIHEMVEDVRPDLVTDPEMNGRIKVTVIAADMMYENNALDIDTLLGRSFDISDLQDRSDSYRPQQTALVEPSSQSLED